VIMSTRSKSNLIIAATAHYAANPAITTDELSQLFAITTDEAAEIIAAPTAREIERQRRLDDARAYAESNLIGSRVLGKMFGICNEQSRIICLEAADKPGTVRNRDRQARHDAKEYAIANPEDSAPVVAKMFGVGARLIHEARARHRFAMLPRIAEQPKPQSLRVRKPRNVLYANLGGELVPCRQVRRWDLFRCFVGAKEVR